MTKTQPNKPINMVLFDPRIDEYIENCNEYGAFIRKSHPLLLNRKLFVNGLMVAMYTHPCFIYVTNAYNPYLLPVLRVFVEKCLPNADMNSFCIQVNKGVGYCLLNNNRFRKMW